MGQSRPIFSFIIVFYTENFSGQQDSSSDHRSRRQERWSLDRHHGPCKRSTYKVGRLCSTSPTVPYPLIAATLAPISTKLSPIARFRTRRTMEVHFVGSQDSVSEWRRRRRRRRRRRWFTTLASTHLAGLLQLLVNATSAYDHAALKWYMTTIGIFTASSKLYNYQMWHNLGVL